MKKLLVFGLALVLVAAFTLPASALENQFGGYFEAVFNTYKSLDFEDEGSKDYSTARTRTRLYYTAKLTDKLRLVNQFEMDTEFGQQDSYGDLGADGINVEVKRSYLDFELADFRFEVGTQAFMINRGLVINDDASGIKVSWRGVEKSFIPAFWWYRLNNGDKVNGDDGADMDHYTALVNIKTGNLQIVPSIGYLTSNSGKYPTTGDTFNDAIAYGVPGDAMSIFFAGLDINWKSGNFDLEFTGVYESGELNDNLDISAYALWGKAAFKFGNIGLWGAALYATGEEAGGGSGDYDGFWYPEQNSFGANFSTSELVRKGDDWTKVTDYTNGNSPENRMEFGAGVDFAVTPNVKLFLSFWNLNLAEDAAGGDSDVGNEIDAKATIGLMKNLNLDLIGAYLIVGDAYKPATNDNDAYELSARLRLSF